MKRLRREKKASRKRKSSRDENTNKTSANKVRRCRLAVASLLSSFCAIIYIERSVSSLPSQKSDDEEGASQPTKRMEKRRNDYDGEESN
jgi:hypothetical protein